MSTAKGLEVLIEDLFEESEALLAHIKTAAENSVYEDSFIESIQNSISGRQAIIDHLENESQQQNVTLKAFIDAEVPKDRCEDLIDMEKEISNGLKLISRNIQKSRQLFQKKQRSRQQYRNPFASVERDGMFVDKRK